MTLQAELRRRDPEEEEEDDARLLVPLAEAVLLLPEVMEALLTVEYRRLVGFVFVASDVARLVRLNLGDC